MKKTQSSNNSNNKVTDIDKSKLKNKVKELEKALGINTSFRNVPLYLILGGWLCVISTIKPIIIVGLIFAGAAFLLSLKKSYKDAYGWNKAITLYYLDDIEKAKIHLDKLSSSEKEGNAYKKMLELIN